MRPAPAFRIRCSRFFILLALGASVLPARLTKEALAAPVFPNPVQTVGASPSGMARADFDGDGHADLLVANREVRAHQAFGELSFLRGLGDGVFAGEVRIPVPHAPRDVQAGDFDGDGAPDVVIVYAQGAAVLYGRGDGTFEPEAAISSDVTSVRVARFNGDVASDLMLNERAGGAGRVRALLGHPSRALQAANPFLTGGYGTAVADIDRDGFDDVVAITGEMGPCSEPRRNTIRLFRGQGTGDFVEAGGFQTGLWNQWILAADLDGDTRTDFIIEAVSYKGCSGDTGRRIYYGGDNWTFTAARGFETHINAYDVVAADFNHDGQMDWLETDSTSLQMHLGRGNRTWIELPPILTGREARVIRSGDDDGDGELDLAVLSTWSEAVFTYRGNGDGTFGPATQPALFNIAPTSVATADLDGDGDLDLAASSPYTGSIVVVPGNGEGGFGQATSYAVGAGPDDLVTADFNGDGAPDLAVTVLNWTERTPERLPDGGLVLLINDGSGRFGPGSAYPAGKFPVALATADLDSDGIQDLLVAHRGDESIGLRGGLSAYYGNGNGTLRPPRELPVGVIDQAPASSYPASLSTGDFNGDGRLDIVAGMSGSDGRSVTGEVEILYGNAGGFDPFVRVLSVRRAGSVTVGDLDQDGRPDIAVAEVALQQAYDPGGIRVLFSHGDGTFTPSPLLAAGPGPFDVRIVDFNLDGTPDLAVNNNGAYLALLPGTGGGGFGPALGFGLLGVPLAFVTGDFDGDGLPDWLMMGSSGSFLLGTADGAPRRFAVDGAIVAGRGRARDSATVQWRTNAESDLTGFNVVVQDGRGMRRLNGTPIPCSACTTGEGRAYAFALTLRNSPRAVYIEAVFADGRTRLFGPFVRAGTQALNAAAARKR